MTPPPDKLAFTPGPTGTAYACPICGATVIAGEDAENLAKHEAWHQKINDEFSWLANPVFGGS